MAWFAGSVNGLHVDAYQQGGCCWLVFTVVMKEKRHFFGQVTQNMRYAWAGLLMALAAHDAAGKTLAMLPREGGGGGKGKKKIPRWAFIG